MIVVFGGGGERDRAKRPLMGAVASRRADVVVVTSDNPRSEDPAAIAADIAAGARLCGESAVELDRRAAIEHALRAARPGDVVVVAGKGHEDYQELAHGRVPFDDRAVVTEVLAALRVPATPGE